MSGDVAARCRAALAGLDLVDPGRGRTAARWLALLELARRDDVSVARLVEAHVDAVAILHEAGLEPEGGALYGVWASVGPGGRDVALDRPLDAGTTVTGTKPFCSGVGVVDRALVDVHDGGGGTRRRLVELDVTPAPTWTTSGGWAAPALADTATGSVGFERHPVARSVGVMPSARSRRTKRARSTCRAFAVIRSSSMRSIRKRVSAVSSPI